MSFSYDVTWSYFPLFATRELTTSDSISGNFAVTLYPYWFKQVTLEWKIPSDWGACHFFVYKSQTENGPFDKLTPAALPPEINFFKDTTTQDFSKFNRSWYIIEALLPSGKRIQSEPQTWNNTRLPWVELRAQEIQRRAWLLLNKFVGVECYAFRRRTYGKRCHYCWNFELEKVTKDKCPFCMGTSFEGGYFPGVKTLFQFDADPTETRLEYFGKWETNDVFIWTIAFPDLRQRDLIYRVQDSALFEVNESKQTTLQSVTVHQYFRGLQLDKESPEYQIIINNNLIPPAYQT